MMNRRQLENAARKGRSSHTHGGHSSAAGGWTKDDTAVAAEPTRHVLGRFRVGAPSKRAHRRGFYRSAS